VSRKGIKLTVAGYCVNPSCRAPLYKELMVCWDDQLCFDCDPPREGLPTAFRLVAEANGGRLPPFDEWPSEGG
jgi:hypothetical protein